MSAIGLWQHLDLTALPIPVLSAPGSTFGNRNLAAEAVGRVLADPPMGERLGVAARASVEGTASVEAYAVRLLGLCELAVERP